MKKAKIILNNLLMLLSPLLLKVGYMWYVYYMKNSAKTYRASWGQLLAPYIIFLLLFGFFLYYVLVKDNAGHILTVIAGCVELAVIFFLEKAVNKVPYGFMLAIAFMVYLVILAKQVFHKSSGEP